MQKLKPAWHYLVLIKIQHIKQVRFYVYMTYQTHDIFQFQTNSVLQRFILYKNSNSAHSES